MGGNACNQSSNWHKGEWLFRSKSQLCLVCLDVKNSKSFQDSCRQTGCRRVSLVARNNGTINPTGADVAFG